MHDREVITRDLGRERLMHLGVVGAVNEQQVVFLAPVDHVEFPRRVDEFACISPADLGVIPLDEKRDLSIVRNFAVDLPK